MKRTFHQAFTLFLENQVRYKLKNGQINATAVAKDLDVTPRTVINMLKDPAYGPRKPLLDKICSVFGVSGDQIMGNELFDWEKGGVNEQSSGLTNLAIESISVFTLDRLWSDYKSVHHAVNDKAYSERFALPSNIADSDHMILIKIEDEANSPNFSIGDMVLVDVRKNPKLGDKVLAASGEQYLIRSIGEDDELFADNRLYKSKKADDVYGTCIHKVSIEKL